MQLYTQSFNLGIPHPPIGTPGGIPSVIKGTQVRYNAESASIALPGAGLKRAVNYYADYGGCGYWRMLWPEYLLNINQRAVISGSTTMVMDKNYYSGAAALKIQRQATPPQAAFFEALKTQVASQNGMKTIYEIDDVVFREDLPEYNKCRDAFTSQDIVNSILRIMGMVDEISVTCDYMRDYYIEKTGNKQVTVIPNYPPKFWAGHQYNREKVLYNLQKNKKRPRIAYSGSGTHFDVTNRTNQNDDFTHVIRTILATRTKYQWVFMGGFPLSLKPYIDNGEIEYHPWVPIMDYISGIQHLNANILIAPLQDNTFNRCKSNIKYVEGAALGIPVICQDMITYKDAPFRFRTGDEMADQIDALVKNHTKYMQASDAARKVAEGLWLEDHLDEHYELYFTKYGSDERKALRKHNP